MLDDEERKAIESRFWSKVEKKKSGCWEWQAVNWRGYGRMHVNIPGICRSAPTHRLSWLLHKGEWPKGRLVCHRCDNPSCVNPDHLFLGSHSDNMRDCAKKRRVSTIGKSRLTHCMRGHEFTDDNTYRDGSGHRRCRSCIKQARLERTEKNRRDRLAAAIRKGSPA